MLATVGLPYVGADVAASAIGIDKAAMKGRFRLHGLPQVAHLALDLARWQREPDLVREELARIPLPWFVKPARRAPRSASRASMTSGRSTRRSPRRHSTTTGSSSRRGSSAP
jgi:carbamoylphosphate synthase large subunit